MNLVPQPKFEVRFENNDFFLPFFYMRPNLRKKPVTISTLSWKHKYTKPLLNLCDILGGASGIGRAVCQALAAEGASIIVTDLNNQGALETTDSLSKHADNKHLNYSLDVASGEEIQKVLECIISEYRKPPCILVNSAGITSDDFLLKMDEEKFDKVIEVNLKVKNKSFVSKATGIQVHLTECM